MGDTNDTAAPEGTPDPSGRLPASGASASHEQSEGSPVDEAALVHVDDVLRAEERARAKVFFRSFQIIAVATACGLPFLPGPFYLRVVAGAGLLFGFAVCTAARWVLQRGGAYSDRLILLVGLGCAVAGVSVVYFVGLFSAAAAALSIGVFFFGGAKSRFAARVTYGAFAGAFFVLSVGLSAGALPDESVFPIAGATKESLWFQTFMTQLLYAVAFYLGRKGQRTLQGAIDRVTAAARQIRQRDAQLAEARQELDRALRPGDGRLSGTTLGPYLLGSLLGRGGMGEVYRAAHLQTKRQAAVKVLHAHLLESPDHKKRFLREAELSLSLHDPHIVQIFDIGETADGAPYLAMELLEGQDLARQLRKAGKLPLEEVVDLVGQIQHALIALRRADLVHRDLKPGNLFLQTDTLTGRGTWKVLDFGLTKVLGSGSTLTQGEILGTPSYMAPEQLTGEVTPLTDLYALAAITYRALTGAMPFDGEDIAEIVFRVAYEQPANPAKFVRLPTDVELVLAIGLAKRPAERFADVEGFAAALEAAAAGDLDDVTRRRGWRLLKRDPWGSSRSPMSIDARGTGVSGVGPARPSGATNVARQSKL